VSLYIGEDKNKSWEDLLYSIDRLPATWESAKLIAFAINLCGSEDKGLAYTRWLAMCALKLAERNRILRGDDEGE
jgi:hypothetical protein